MSRSSYQLHPSERTLLERAGITHVVSVERPEAGQDNTVGLVNGSVIVRVARTEDARAAYQNELAVLSELGGRCRVPAIRFAGSPGMVYDYIPGSPLTPARWLALAIDERGSAADDLRTVLQALHALPRNLPTIPTQVLDAPWVRAVVRRRQHIPPRVPLHFEPRDLGKRFEHAWRLEEPRQVLVHADLKPPNLVLDGARASVIDFGALCVGDPAVDYGVLTHHFGESMLQSMDLADTPLAERARCYADLYHLMRCTGGWTRSAS